MAAFQFPDPAVETTVVNPITGSTYQWKEPPGKWVITTKIRSVDNIIWEGDDEPDPNPGDYKLWYHTEELELYYWYEDVNGVGAWLPTSAPITMLEDLDTSVAEIKADMVAANVAINENTNAIASVVYFGNTAPPIFADENGEQSPLNYKFWLNTDTSRLSVLRIDVDADNGYSYQQIDTEDNVTLQEVLNNGSIADKGLVLTNASDDALLLSPEDARIMIGGIGPNVVPRLELRHKTGGLDTSLVKLELDEDGERFDVECDEKVDNIHFRFENDVKLELNKTGDAVFSGKVKVQPGVEENEVVTYGQLSTVAEELEQLAPSFERGLYSISTQEVTSSSTHNGKYNLIRKNTSSDGNAARAACTDAQNLCNRIPDNDPIDCQIEYNRCIDAIPSPGTVDIYISDFSQVEQLKFSKVDVNGENHTWDGVLIGQLIDVFNEDNDNYMVGRITAIEGTTVKTFSVDVLSSKGSASGNARIKVFSLSETGDVTNYVRKTGDTMTGRLDVKAQSTSPTSLAVYSPEYLEGTATGNIFKVINAENDWLLYVDNKGSVGANAGWEPTDDRHLVPRGWLKKYVSDEIGRRLFDERPKGPASLCWEYRAAAKDQTGPANGCFYKCSKGYWRFSFRTANGVNLAAVYPKDKNWNATGSSRFELTFWERTSSGEWIFKKHTESGSTRWGYKSDKGGSTHFEFYDTWSSHEVTWSTGKIYYVTASGFF